MSGELFSESSTTALVNGIECGGRESNLFLCRGGAWGPQDCPSAGVACTQSSKYSITVESYGEWKHLKPHYYGLVTLLYNAFSDAFG